MSAGISTTRAKGLAGTAEVRRDISLTSDHAGHAGPYSPTASTARKWIVRSLSLIVCGILVCVVTLSILLFHRVRPTVAVNSTAATAAKLREELASQAGSGRSKTPRTLHIRLEFHSRRTNGQVPRSFKAVFWYDGGRREGQTHRRSCDCISDVRGTPSLHDDHH
jgi:hypothetical protein